MARKNTFGIRELAEQAKKAGAFDLAQGVIDASPPQVLIEQAQQLPFERFSSYNNKRGVLEYRKSVRKYLATRVWSVPIKQIAGTSGTTGGTVAALLTDCASGDIVLVPEPFFIGHKLLLEALRFDARYISVPLDVQPDWKALEKQMKGARAFILTTPANPTGQVVPIDILVRLSETAAKHNCLLIIDEMYREFIWDNPPADDSGYSEINWEKTVILRSFSKTYAIPGWRVGFAITSPERVEKMATTHDALYIGGSTIAQWALAKALMQNLEDLNQYVTDLSAQLQKNMTLLSEAFKEYGMNPLPVPATYYMLIKHNRKSDIAAMEELMKKKIVVTPVNILYSDSSKDTGYIRIHFAVKGEVAERVAAILKK